MASRNVNLAVVRYRRAIIREFEEELDAQRLATRVSGLTDEEVHDYMRLTREIDHAADMARDLIASHHYASSTATQTFRRVVNDAGLDREVVR